MIRSLSLSALIITLTFQPAFGSVTLSKPSCDGRVDPIGIDNPRPAFSWRLESPRRGVLQTAYRIEVASSEKALHGGTADLWDSGKVESNQNIHVPYDGKPLESSQDCVYRVTVWDELGESATTHGTFSLGLLHPDDWKAKWIGTPNDTSKSRACPWFRKTFVLDEAPKEAKVYVGSLGYFELYINGEKVGEDVLVPAVTQFTNRSLYLTYDVTKMLHPGKNVIALWMGRGWYTKGLPGVEYDDPTVRLQLEMKDTGGKSTTVVTDKSWKTDDSCISRIGREWRPGGFGGERVDFGKDQPGWNTVDYDDSAWSDAQVRTISPHTVSAQVTEPNRVIERLSAKTIEPFGDDIIVDFGRNMTGWVEWALPKLPAGTKITLEYADRREGDRLWSFNQTDEIISAGGDNEVFRSHFNYHGFRYVVIRGLPKGVEPGKEIAAARIRTNYRDTSQFACSDPLLQQIHDMIKYTLECLSLGGYIVDCTTIERLGYGGRRTRCDRGGLHLFRPAIALRQLAAGVARFPAARRRHAAHRAESLQRRRRARMVRFHPDHELVSLRAIRRSARLGAELRGLQAVARFRRRALQGRHPPPLAVQAVPELVPGRMGLARQGKGGCDPRIG